MSCITLTNEQANIRILAGEAKWSGTMSLPSIGAIVNVPMNNLGRGKVVGYRQTDSWIGLMVRFLDPPAWWLQQCISHHQDPDEGGLVYGAEVREDAPAVRPLREIGREIAREWAPVYYAARPYLNAICQLDKITDSFDQDDGHSVVRYFLENAKSWRGDAARRLKAELRGMLK